MKRMFGREFVVYTEERKFVIFNYPTSKGKENRGKSYMCVKTFFPSHSSWKRLERLLMINKYPAEMVMDELGEMRFVFSAGESLS